MPGASRQIVVNAPMDKVFDTIVDYANYGTFATELRDVKIGQRTGNEVQVTYVIEIIKKIKYTLRHKEQRPNRVDWSFVEGEWMKDNKGHWLLEPAGEGATKVTYNIELSLGPLVPKSVINMLTETGLPKMLENFKRRVESR